MKKIPDSFEQPIIARHLIYWTVLSLPVALLVGTLVAVFMGLLAEVTRFRWAHHWLLFLLPLAGVGVHFLYKRFGKGAEGGNNLIVDEIFEPSAGVPARMAPLILFTTLVTHLFGGSAGREGTAVQIGGSVAQWVGRRFMLNKTDMRLMLMVGIAAGFGAAFGTPVAAAIFALEVLAIGRIKFEALLPCLIAAVFSDWVCSAWLDYYNLPHDGFAHLSLISWGFHRVDLILISQVLLAGILFGLTAFVFSTLVHKVQDLSKQYITLPWLIPFIGGCIVIIITLLLGTQDYLGLGALSQSGMGISVRRAFLDGGSDTWSWLWKLILTVVTLGMGFKGGEVTPLFFIGATLGNSIAVFTGAPVDLMAGLGFLAVFAAATNTPLAAVVLGVELFGGENVHYYAVACFTAYYFSGHTGIYTSQRVAVDKTGRSKEGGEQSLKHYNHEKGPDRDEWFV